MKNSNNLFLRLSANYTSLYFYLGIMTPFWGMWLKSKGLSPSEIGIIIALPYIMKVLIVPLISQAADRRDEYWRPLMIAVVFGTVFSTFYFFGTGFWQLFFITGAVNLFVPAITPLLETITISQVRRQDLNYGRIRSFGSIAFIGAAVILGFLLKEYSIDNVMLAIYGSMLIMIITTVALPRGNKRRNNKDSLGSPIGYLLKNKDFVWFLVIVGLLQMSHGVFYSMGSIYWQENGIGEDVIGLLWAVAVLSEILLFVFCDNLIRKYSVFLIFAVIGFVGTIRWAVFTFTFSLPILFGAQLLHALTFGASHLAAIHYLGSKINPSRAGTAQSLYSSLPLGLGMGVATYLGGVTYEYADGGAYLTMSFFCLGAFVLSLIKMFSIK
jgi:PPP family 3-phenylpropionic acid transporter|tara:strand:+ start:46 stop:1194 length:1149 start_codon:yes stop_codon:yes gene_type:complete